MRVLILTTEYLPVIGGSEIAIEHLTRHLGGIFFDILTTRPRKQIPASEVRANVTIHRVGSKWLFPIVGFCKAFSLMRRHRYEHILAFQASYAGGAAWLMKWCFPRATFVLSFQEGKKLDEQGAWIRFFRNIILRKADVITAISTYLTSYARTVNPQAKVVLVPNGVDVTSFAGASMPTSKTIISVSRLVPKNGIDTLVEALALLPEYRLLLVGSGDMQTALQELAQKIHVVERVRFAGSVPNHDLPSLLHQSSVFVRPSRSEGLGVAFLEAMAARLPVVATPVGGIPDLIRNRETGLVCEVDNPVSIAQAVRELETNPALRQHVVDGAYALVRERYDWGIIAQQYHEIISHHSGI